MAAIYTVDQAWGAWSTGTYNNTDTTTSQIVWQAWAGTAATITTVSNVTNTVWDAWTLGTGTGAFRYVLPELTEEQIEANRVAAEARAAAAAVRQAEMAAAKERARTLLLEALADDQQKELIQDGCFHVETRDGTRRYRLSPTGQPRRVRGEDGLAWAYCIHPDHGYPQDDVVLAQKLLLESDEEAFLRIANARQVQV